MKIKICGITSEIEAQYLNEANVDYAGFVFYEKSKRNIDVDSAKKIFEKLNSNIQKVAVMVSPNVEQIEMVQDAGFDVIQIHKELSREVLKAATLPLWYAVNISNIDEVSEKQKLFEQMPDDLADKIKAIVVDAPDFGSGQTFNWHKSRRMLKAGAQSPPEEDNIFSNRQFILAGGLRPENVAEGIGIFTPDMVDVSSGVEGDKGKDKQKIDAFVKAVRQCRE